MRLIKLRHEGVLFANSPFDHIDDMALTRDYFGNIQCMAS